MENVKILPRGCKQTVSITPGESCFSMQSKAKEQEVEMPTALTNPFASIGQPKAKKEKKQQQQQQRPMSVNEDDFDLLINQNKRKTDTQLQTYDDGVYASTPKPRNMFTSNNNNDIDEHNYDDNNCEDDDAEYTDESVEYSDYDDNQFNGVSNPVALEPAMTRRDIIRRKAQVLGRLERRETFTGVKIDYDPKGDLEYLETIDAKCSYKSNSTISVDMMRRMLIFSCASMEAMSKKLTFLAIDLDGWSEQIMLSMNQYDEILFEIYDYYSGDIDINPLLKLGFAVLSSAMMYSFARQILSSTRFKEKITKDDNNMPRYNNNAHSRVATVNEPSQNGFSGTFVTPPPSTAFINATEPENIDEIGVMSGPDDIIADDVPEEKIIDEFRRQQDQQVLTGNAITLPAENEAKEMKVKISAPIVPKKAKRGGAKTRSSAAQKTVVTMT